MIAGMTAVGVAAGALWVLLAPPVHGVVVVTKSGKRVHEYVGNEADHFFDSAVMMAGLLVGLGVVSAVLVWQWRQRRGLVWSLREEHETPPERLLQAIWFHQRLKRDQLRTVDGKTVRVLHPGFWNREAGPDFRGAMIQFDNDPPQSGDARDRDVRAFAGITPGALVRGQLPDGGGLSA